MPRQLALALCVCFIVWLFRADMKQRRAGWALLVPGLWLSIIGSRPLGYWFTFSGDISASSVEGNPINLVVQGALMLAALAILQRRDFAWRSFAENNKGLVLIYAYFVLSALWSFYPFISIKRIIRDFGTVLMVLVILTENDPFTAARVLFVRCAYVLFPLSLVFIKYYPEIGRLYSRGWATMYTGVTTHKNTLGLVTLVFGLMVLLDLMEMRRINSGAMQKSALRVRYGMLLVAGWLLYMSHSATSWLCALLAITVLWGTGYLLRLRNTRPAVVSILIGGLCLCALDQSLDISGTILEAMGRNTTLTGRTRVWQLVREQEVNPVVGCGFLNFWDSPIGQALDEEYNLQINTAHNGYLETYLDGGVVGVLLLAGMLFGGGKRALEGLFSEALLGRTRLMYFIVALVYDWSESSFFRLDALWFALLLFIIKCPSTHAQSRCLNPGAELEEVGSEIVHTA